MFTKDKENKNLEFNNSNPTALIINVASLLGIKLSAQLITQGINVYAVDVLNKETTVNIKQLKDVNPNNIKVYDLNSIEWNYFKPKRLDYIIYLDNDIPHEISSKEFLEKSKSIDSIFSLASYFKAKTIIVNDLNVLKKDKHTSGVKTKEDLYTYIEDLFNEYASVKNMNGRILNMASVYGTGDTNKNSAVNNLIQKAIKEKRIVEKGDGLSFSYYIYLEDAVAVLLKVLFEDVYSKQVLSAAGGPAISYMSVAYMVGAFSNKEVLFERGSSSVEVEDRLKSIVNPVPGWIPRVRLEEGLEYVYQSLTSTPSSAISKSVEQIQVPVSNEAQSPIGIKDFQYKEDNLVNNNNPFELNKEPVVEVKKVEEEEVKGAEVITGQKQNEEVINQQPVPDVIPSVKNSSLFDDRASTNVSLDDLRKKYLNDDIDTSDKKGHSILRFILVNMIIIVVIIFIFLLYKKGYVNFLSYNSNVSQLNSQIATESISQSTANSVISSIDSIQSGGIINNSKNSISQATIAEKYLGLSALSYVDKNYQSSTIYASMGAGLETDKSSFNKMENLANQNYYYQQILNIKNATCIVIIGNAPSNYSFEKIVVSNGNVYVLALDASYKTIMT